MHDQRQKFKVVYLEVFSTTMNSLVARSTMPLAQLSEILYPSHTYMSVTGKALAMG